MIAIEGKLSRIHTIIHRIEEEYGVPTPGTPRDPLDTLINTILSQNTNDLNRDRAFTSLVKRYPTWEEARKAPVRSLASAIRVGGLAQIKAQRIKLLLNDLQYKQGELSLKGLNHLTDEEAFTYLLSFKGVGPKTAACVLLFALSRPVFPVDTHIFRVSVRLGLVSTRGGRVAAQRRLQEMVPPDAVYPFHINLIRHGRKVCRPRKPRCHECCLSDLCPSAGTF
jgi:endonuclease-3